MSTTTMRVDGTVKSTLHDVATQTGESMSVVLARAVECYRRQAFLERANAAFAALRADPEAWQEELAERALWDATIADGLEDREDTHE